MILIVEDATERICNDAERILDAHARGVVSDADLREWQKLIARLNIVLQDMAYQPEKVS